MYSELHQQQPVIGTLFMLRALYKCNEHYESEKKQKQQQRLTQIKRQFQ